MVWKIEKKGEVTWDMSLYGVFEKVFNKENSEYTHSPMRLIGMKYCDVSLFEPKRSMVVEDSDGEHVMDMTYYTMDAGTTLVIKDVIIAPQYRQCRIMSNLLNRMKDTYDVIIFKHVYNSLLHKVLIDNEFVQYNKHTNALPLTLESLMIISNDTKLYLTAGKYYEKGFDICGMYWTSIVSYKELKVAKSPAIEESAITTQHTSIIKKDTECSCDIGIISFIKKILRIGDK